MSKKRYERTLGFYLITFRYLNPRFFILFFFQQQKRWARPSINPDITVSRLPRRFFSITNFSHFFFKLEHSIGLEICEMKIKCYLFIALLVLTLDKILLNSTEENVLNIKVILMLKKIMIKLCGRWTIVK